MSWTCFGWVGNFCHTGTDHAVSETDGICVQDHDQDYDPPSYPFNICFIVLNKPGINNLNRQIVSFFENVEFDRITLNNSWAWAYVTTRLDYWYNEGRYRYELQDRYGNVICKREVFTGEITEEIPVIDDPIEEDIPFDEIVEGVALIVNAGVLKAVGEINENQNLIEDVQDSVNSMPGGINNQIKDSSSEVKEIVAVSAMGISGRVSKLAGSLTDGLNGLADKIDGLQYPNIADVKYAFMDAAANLAIALWDAILDRIEERYPDDTKEID